MKTQVYITKLEREIALLDEVVDKQLENLPAEIEKSVKNIIKEKISKQDFLGYIAQDLYSAYVEAGGRKALGKIIKDNPKEVMKILKMLIDIGIRKEDRNDSKGSNQQVFVNINGLPLQ